MENTYSGRIDDVCQVDLLVAGIPVTVYGLGEIHEFSQEISCLWLLHPRLGMRQTMDPMAASLVTDWTRNFYDPSSASISLRRRLVAVSFDQRNHGDRKVDPKANKTWVEGNSTHAQDMFAIYHGTSADVSVLMEHLESALLLPFNVRIVSHIIIGVSLGGHAAWQCLLHEPRISAGVVVIGCPDYLRLMHDRFRRSAFPELKQLSQLHGSDVSTKVFPDHLVEAICRWDPAGLLVGSPAKSGPTNLGMEYQEDALLQTCDSGIEIIRRKLRGKKILNILGGADELVPYKCCEPFLTWLQKAAATDGALANESIALTVIVEEGIGHEMTTYGAQEVNRFVMDTLSGGILVRSPPSASTGLTAKL